jgi:hypothetical protein
MKHLVLPLLAALVLHQAVCPQVSAKEQLPQALTVVGEKQYASLMAKAKAGQWHKLPISDRILRFAMELRGTPYKGYTLEIHDHIESPSVNFAGLDCWTFFETSLCLARKIENGNYDPNPSSLLRHIEFTRYPLQRQLPRPHPLSCRVVFRK